MKLVDILAREMSEWPEGAAAMTQDLDMYVGSVSQSELDDGPTFNSAGSWDVPGDSYMEMHSALSEDYKTAIVTRSQWQAAVDALKAGECEHSHGNEKGCPECGQEFERRWNGEGTPPAGTSCEYNRANGLGNWRKATILCVGERRVFFRDHDGDELSRSLTEVMFRPIRTAEQIAAEERDAGIKEIAEFLGDIACDDWIAARELYDAGYRKFEIVES